MPLHIAIWVYPQVSISLALLIRDLFQRADALAGTPGKSFLVRLCGDRPLETEGLVLTPHPFPDQADWILVPPFGEGFDGKLDFLAGSLGWMADLCRRGTGLASACLGALVAAEAGLLDGKKATTHWRWVDHARLCYPLVAWQPREMLVDEGPVVTAGGYLAAVDLCLHLVGRLAGSALAADLGRRLLADTLRQKQSVYAQKLTWTAPPQSPFAHLDLWIEQNLERSFTIDELRSPYPMGARNFHRKFTAEFGTTPIQYVQLKRIERAQVLLRDTESSLEQILEKIGVSDPVSFRRIFERELGMSPSRYRRQFREGRIRV